MDKSDHSAYGERKSKGCFVVLEGIDGAGKTTLSSAVAASSPHLNMVFCPRRGIATSPSFAEKCMKDLAAILWPGGSISFGHLLPPHYWLSLHTAWYSLLSEFVISPLLENKHIVVVDGWHYKHTAKALCQGLT